MEHFDQELRGLQQALSHPKCHTQLSERGKDMVTSVAPS